MNKLLFCLILCGLLWHPSVYAQKFGYVDADFILKQMPSYQTAQKEIEKSVSKWQEDIDERNLALEEMKSAYLAEELLLTDEMKEERQKEIEKETKAVRDYQQQIFGFQGLYFSRQQELIKPVQEEMYEAVQKVARANSLQIVFSNTQGVSIIYAEPRHDYTEEVLKELNLLDEEENPENKD